MTKLYPKGKHETIWEASCSVVEDALSTRFVGEDEVFFTLFMNLMVKLNYRKSLMLQAIW